jgi:uncharacterized protein (TIGR00369 family)
MNTEALEPRDPAYEAKVRDSFARQPLMATLGATLTRVEPGLVHVALPYRADLCQQNGFLHAGAVASVADSACGYAAFTLSAPETDVLAVEFKISLLAPAHGERFEARARVLRSGRTLSNVLAEVIAIEAGRETAVAAILSTIVIRSRRD